MKPSKAKEKTDVLDEDNQCEESSQETIPAINTISNGLDLATLFGKEIDNIPEEFVIVPVEISAETHQENTTVKMRPILQRSWTLPLFPIPEEILPEEKNNIVPNDASPSVSEEDSGIDVQGTTDEIKEAIDHPVKVKKPKTYIPFQVPGTIAVLGAPGSMVMLVNREEMEKQPPAESCRKKFPYAEYTVPMPEMMLPNDDTDSDEYSDDGVDYNALISPSQGSGQDIGKYGIETDKKDVSDDGIKHENQTLISASTTKTTEDVCSANLGHNKPVIQNQDSATQNNAPLQNNAEEMTQNAPQQHSTQTAIAKKTGDIQGYPMRPAKITLLQYHQQLEAYKNSQKSLALAPQVQSTPINQHQQPQFALPIINPPNYGLSPPASQGSYDQGCSPPIGQNMPQGSQNPDNRTAEDLEVPQTQITPYYGPNYGPPNNFAPMTTPAAQYPNQSGYPHNFEMARNGDGPPLQMIPMQGNGQAPVGQLQQMERDPNLYYRKQPTTFFPPPAFIMARHLEGCPMIQNRPFGRFFDNRVWVPLSPWMMPPFMMRQPIDMFGRPDFNFRRQPVRQTPKRKANMVNTKIRMITEKRQNQPNQKWQKKSSPRSLASSSGPSSSESSTSAASTPEIGSKDEEKGEKVDGEVYFDAVDFLMSSRNSNDTNDNPKHEGAVNELKIVQSLPTEEPNVARLIKRSANRRKLRIKNASRIVTLLHLKRDPLYIPLNFIVKRSSPSSANMELPVCREIIDTVNDLVDKCCLAEAEQEVESSVKDTVEELLNKVIALETVNCVPTENQVFSEIVQLSEEDVPATPPGSPWKKLGEYQPPAIMVVKEQKVEVLRTKSNPWIPLPKIEPVSCLENEETTIPKPSAHSRGKAIFRKKVDKKEVLMFTNFRMN